MTMTTLSELIAAVQDVVGTVSGIREAPDLPPDKWPSGGLYALLFPATGTYREVTRGQEEGQHTLHLLVATPRGASWRSDWDRALAIGDPVAVAILSAGTLTGVILQTDELRYTFGNLEWAGQQLIGWRFELDVLLSGSLS